MKDIKSDNELNILNHSCAHLMAHAIKHLYPNAKFWVGPVIEEGFYYDIDLGKDSLKEEDLGKIEKEMRSISKQQIDIIRMKYPKRKP
jgi:threonyl-tRNA synthetase